MHKDKKGRFTVGCCNWIDFASRLGASNNEDLEGNKGLTNLGTGKHRVLSQRDR